MFTTPVTRLVTELILFVVLDIIIALFGPGPLTLLRLMHVARLATLNMSSVRLHAILLGTVILLARIVRARYLGTLKI